MSDRDDPTLPSEDDAAALLADFELVDDEDPATLLPPAPVVDAGNEHDLVDRATQDRATHGRPALVANLLANRGWAYLGLLLTVFVGLALLAYGCDDGPVVLDGGAPASTTEAMSATPLPSELMFVIDGDTVTLTGPVPDEQTRSQLVELAEARYGPDNVIDQLTVDDGFTLDGATVSVRGSTIEGDGLPEGLVADVIAAMNLEAAGFDVLFTEPETTVMDLEAEVSASGVGLSGSVPDRSTLDAVVSAATTVWGAGNVDAAGLGVDELVVLSNGTVRVSGAADAGDSRAAEFATIVGGTLGVEVEDSVEIDVGAEALRRLEDRFRQILAAGPIVFVTDGAVIDPQSDAVLRQAAAAITAAPGVAVEIVGHTDDQGDAAASQVLSQSRASAVVQRLVELGVDQTRLSARGAGGAEPVADNATEEGRAANRRIAFEFQGAAEG